MVIHGVISDDNAKEVVKYLQANGKFIPHITAVREHIVLNVTSPENMTKNMDAVVDGLVVKQVLKSCEFKDWKGCAHFNPEFIAVLNHFGQDGIELDSFIPCPSKFALL